MPPHRTDDVVQDSAVPVNGDLQNTTAVVHETDHRDGKTASPSSNGEKPKVDQTSDHIYEPIPVPQDADSSTVTLITSLNKSNYMIFQQGEKIHRLENALQERSLS